MMWSTCPTLGTFRVATMEDSEGIRLDVKVSLRRHANRSKVQKNFWIFFINDRALTITTCCRAFANTELHAPRHHAMVFVDVIHLFMTSPVIASGSPHRSPRTSRKAAS